MQLYVTHKGGVDFQSSGVFKKMIVSILGWDSIGPNNVPTMV